MGSFVREHIKKRQTIDKGSTQDKGTLTVKNSMTRTTQFFSGMRHFISYNKSLVCANT